MPIHLLFVDPIMIQSISIKNVIGVSWQPCFPQVSSSNASDSSVHSVPLYMLLLDTFWMIRTNLSGMP